MTRPEFDALLIVPQEYENRRLELRDAIVSAFNIVGDFAEQYHWSLHMRKPFFCRIEIYATQEALWRRILEVNELSDIPVPTDALTAALEKEILLAVVPEEAKRARPEYFQDQEDWIRALAHEIVHRLHVRILKGNEDAMGPEWFFEGFAVVGSGQALGKDVEVEDVEQALKLANSRGRGAYGRYAAAVRFFAERIGLPELVAQAGQPGFEDWLRFSMKSS